MSWGNLPEKSRMDVKIATEGGSHWGRLILTTPSEICAAVQLQPGLPLRVQGPRYIWRPEPALAAKLPSGFQLPVDCLFVQPNGRFFVPPGGFDNASEFTVCVSPGLSDSGGGAG